MSPPPGMDIPSHQVLKLQKSLYGLKQASRQWYGKLSTVLKQKGFVRSSNDYSLFSKSMGNSTVHVAVYVDDILVTGNNSQEIGDLKDFLHTTFQIKDLGILNYFLGLEVLHHSTGTILTQRKFAMDLVKEFDDSALPVSACPLPPHLQLRTSDGDVLPDPLKYRQLVGKLNYLTHTRPDLAFAVQFLSQFMQDPRLPHWTAALHTISYVKSTASQGLFFNNSPTFELHAYCDSDWASCPNTRKSVSGYFVSFGGSPLSWKSKKQPTVALSSAEAEYRSMRRVTAELAWLTRLLSELKVPNVTPIPLKCDSQAAIHIAKNPVFHERTKHIELDCHFVREKLQEGLITLSHTRTIDQVADIFTKSLPTAQHSVLLHKLGILDPPT
ncbi:putative RNA-directed DNA polymerase [Helianthus annuus]|nr:putative RNA-directed DNA polymerase [Helianthus annuus]